MGQRRILCEIEHNKPRRDTRTHVHKGIIHLIGEKRSSISEMVSLLTHETLHIVLGKLFPKGGPSHSLDNISFLRGNFVVLSYCCKREREP